MWGLIWGLMWRSNNGKRQGEDDMMVAVLQGSGCHGLPSDRTRNPEETAIVAGHGVSLSNCHRTVA